MPRHVQQAVRTHPVDKLLERHCYKSAAGLLQLVRFYVCSASTRHQPLAYSTTPGTTKSLELSHLANVLERCLDLVQYATLHTLRFYWPIFLQSRALKFI